MKIQFLLLDLTKEPQNEMSIGLKKISQAAEVYSKLLSSKRISL